MIESLRSVDGSRLNRCTGPPQIGFVFDPLETAWDQSLEKLRLVSEANGGVAHVSTLDPARRILGVWCMHQARAYPPLQNSLRCLNRGVVVHERYPNRKGLVPARRVISQRVRFETWIFFRQPRHTAELRP